MNKKITDQILKEIEKELKEIFINRTENFKDNTSKDKECFKNYEVLSKDSLNRIGVEKAIEKTTEKTTNEIIKLIEDEFNKAKQVYTFKNKDEKFIWFKAIEIFREELLTKIRGKK